VCEHLPIGFELWLVRDQSKGGECVGVIANQIVSPAPGMYERGKS
jgi:hypothetical protein